MCGRYASSRSDADLVQAFDVDDVVGEAPGPSWNIAPTQQVRAVLEQAPKDEPDASTSRRLRSARWGLVPAWAKNTKIGNKMINARVRVLSYLVRLTESLTVDGQTLPGWWTGQAPAGQAAHRFPGGHGNLGISHGIAGPLALLATATRHGTTVAGQAEAIDRICGWLERWRCGTEDRPWWPARISLAEWRAGTVSQAGPQRPSWCYATPGLARAQQLAALALDDQRFARRAEQALAGCVADEQQLALLVGVSLCHGWAGLVHTPTPPATSWPPGCRSCGTA